MSIYFTPQSLISFTHLTSLPEFHPALNFTTHISYLQGDDCEKTTLVNKKNPNINNNFFIYFYLNLSIFSSIRLRSSLISCTSS